MGGSWALSLVSPGHSKLTWLALALLVGGCDRTTAPPTNAPVFGGIEVSVQTSGEDKDADGYSVVVDGVGYPLPPNGTITLTTVPVGSRQVALEGVAGNCTAGNGVLRNVTVNAAQTVVVNFTVTCVTRGGGVPGYATLQITTATTGSEQDPNGYSIQVWNSGLVASAAVPVSGSVSVSVIAGANHTVVLNEIAPNCRVQSNGSPDFVVHAPSGATIPLSFAVVCESAYTTRLPDGMQLAFTRAGRIHLVNSDGTGLVPLTEGPRDCEPAWSPDGARLAFVRGCHDSPAIYVMNADGTNLVRRTQGEFHTDPTWSSDGTKIAFSAIVNGNSEIYSVSATEDGKPATAVVSRPGWDGDPAWSPNGSWVAYSSDWIAYDFTSDIFLAAPEGVGSGQLTSGFAMWPNLVQYFRPAWSADSKELAVVECAQAFSTCDASSLTVLKVDGSSFRRLALTRGFVAPSWSPDGRTIAFSSGGTIQWIRADGTERGLIVADGYDPVWRPSPGARIVR